MGWGKVATLPVNRADIYSRGSRFIIHDSNNRQTLDYLQHSYIQYVQVPS